MGALLFGAAMVVVLYSPVLGSWFVGDDLEEILGGLGGGGAVPTQDLHGGRNFRPLNLWMHGATQRIWGWEPLPFHLTAVVGHVVASLLVGVMTLAILRWFRVTGPRGLPVLAGALFAVAPNHPEAVSWISTRGDVLIVCAGATSLICWCRSGRSAAWTVAAVGAFGVALVSKEAAVVLPAVVTVLEVGRSLGGVDDGDRERRSAFRSAWASWPYWAALVAYVAVRRLALGTVKSGSFREEFIGESLTALARRSMALVIRTFVPGMQPHWWVVVAAGTFVVAALAFLSTRHPANGHESGAGPMLAALAVGVVVAIAPVGHLGASATTVAGERLIYLPSAFAAVLVAWPLARLAESWRRVGTAAIVVVLCAASASLYGVNRGWAESARAAESFTEQLGRFPRNEPVLLLNSPDLVGGAQSMRNSISPAMYVRHGWELPAPVWDLAQVAQAGPDDRVEVRRGPGARTWRLRLVEPGARFVSVAPLPEVSVRRVGDDEIEIVVAADAAPRSVAYFSGGRLIDVPAFYGPGS